jgi:flagellar biosynthesis protein FlhF
MRVKRFQASDMQSALKQVRGNLGPDAVILSTRGLPAGNYGTGGIEVLAGSTERTARALTPRPVAILERTNPAADAPPAAAPAVHSQSAPAARAHTLVGDMSADDVRLAVSIAMAREAEGGEATGPIGRDGRRAAFSVTEERKVTLNVPQFKRVTRDGENLEDLEALTRPFAEMLRRATGGECVSGAEDAIDVTPRPSSYAEPEPSDSFDRQVDAGRPFDSATDATAARRAVKPSVHISEARDVVRARPAEVEIRTVPQTPHRSLSAGGAAREAAERAYALLCEAGLSEEVAETALEAAVRGLPAVAVKRTSRLVEAAFEALAGDLPDGPTLKCASLAGKAVFVVGPAGVGKTTAVLKAALQLRREGADVAIVGTDISRLGSAEQLQRYGELLRLPVTIAYSPEQLSRNLAASPAGRVTLVDTPACRLGIDSRSQRGARRRETVDEVLPLLAAAPNRVVVLAVAAGTSEAELRRLAYTARALDAEAAIVTKLDEVAAPAAGDVPAPGTVLNVVAHLNLPPLLCSTGRDVLADLATLPAGALVGAAAEACAAL